MLKIILKKGLTGVRGFTLLEVMTVMAIMGILAAISTPNLIAWRETARIHGATRDLMSDLSMARLHSIKNGYVVTVKFENGGYIMFIDDNDNDTADTGEKVLRRKNYPPGVCMRSTTFTKAKTTLHRSGAVSPAGSVTLERGGGPRMRIIVSVAGRIRMAAT